MLVELAAAADFTLAVALMIRYAMASDDLTQHVLGRSLVEYGHRWRNDEQDSRRPDGRSLLWDSYEDPVAERLRVLALRRYRACGLSVVGLLVAPTLGALFENAIGVAVRVNVFAIWLVAVAGLIVALGTARVLIAAMRWSDLQPLDRRGFRIGVGAIALIAVILLAVRLVVPVGGLG